MRHARAVLWPGLLVLTGCTSFAFVRGPEPPGHPARALSATTCTTSKGWVWFDRILGTGYVWIAAAARDDDGTFEEDYGMSLNAARALWIAAGVLGWSSASVGNRRVNECRAAGLEPQLPASADSATSVDG